MNLDEFIETAKRLLESAEAEDPIVTSKTFAAEGNRLFSESKAQADVDLLNDHPDGFRPLLKLTDDGTGTFTTPPFPKLDKPLSRDDILDIYSLDKDEWEVSTMEVLSRWAWFRDEQGEDAVTRPAHQYRGKVVSKTAALGSRPNWDAPGGVNPVQVSFGRSNRAVKNTDIVKAIIFPDQQIGYGFYPDATFYTTHHTEAISTALQIAERREPDVIVNVGDMLDFAQWSDKYLPPPEQAFSTQAALECAHLLLASQKAIADRVGVTEGNHEARLLGNIMKNAKEAYKLTKAGEEEYRPLLILQNLLDTDALGVEWFAGYGNSWWLRDDLVVHHGKTLAMKKQSQKPITASTISGHIHRAEMQSRTYTGIGGREIQTIHFSPGTLCRTTGEVPSTLGGHNEMGQPLRHIEDWQLGIGQVTYVEDMSIPPVWEMIPISPAGVALCDGEIIYPDADIIEALDDRSIAIANGKRSPQKV